MAKEIHAMRTKSLRDNKTFRDHGPIPANSAERKVSMVRPCLWWLGLCPFRLCVPRLGSSMVRPCLQWLELCIVRLCVPWLGLSLVRLCVPWLELRDGG
jgi:hypothetical protein